MGVVVVAAWPAAPAAKCSAGVQSMADAGASGHAPEPDIGLNPVVPLATPAPSKHGAACFERIASVLRRYRRTVCGFGRQVVTPRLHSASEREIPGRPIGAARQGMGSDQGPANFLTDRPITRVVWHGMAWHKGGSMLRPRHIMPEAPQLRLQPPPLSLSLSLSLSNPLRESAVHHLVWLAHRSYAGVSCALRKRLAASAMLRGGIGGRNVCSGVAG
eukprot:349682-Chlamydomonas_euryale.AAC.4